MEFFSFSIADSTNRISTKRQARLYWRTLSRITLIQHTMDGIFGWLGDHGAHQDLIKQMGRAACLSPEGQLQEHSSKMLGIAGCSRFGKAGIHVKNGLAAALHCWPQVLDEGLTAIERTIDPQAIYDYLYPKPLQCRAACIRACTSCCPTNTPRHKKSGA